MENLKALDQYLYSLEKHLNDLSPIDRAKIIIEIEEHIKEALTKFEDKSIHQVLDDLGHPQKVANHYRLDRGLRTFKPEKHPILKWLTITFLGSVAAFFIFIIVIVWKFTPIMEIDEKQGKLVMLGGLIDINRTSGKVKIMDQYSFIDNKYTNSFDGAIDFPRDELDELVVNFKSGVINFKPSIDGKLSWNCKLDTAPTEEFLNRGQDVIEMDLESFEGISCDIQVPSNIKLTVDGKDAQITVTDPDFDTYIEINNGQVFFNPNPEIDYTYDIKVKNGLKSDYTSSTNKDAFEVRVYIENGSIQKSN